MNEHKDVQVDSEKAAKQRAKLEKRHARIAPILQGVYEVTEEFTFSRPWSFLRPDRDCRSGVTDDLNVVDILAEHHSPEHLIEAGVAVVDDEGELAENPRLADGPLVFLRTDDGECFDIMTADGTCITGGCPFFRAAHDQLTRNTSTPGRLLAVSSMDDVTRLRAAGIAAVPLTSLGSLSAAGLRRLMRLVGAGCNAKISTCPDRLKQDLPDDVVQPDGEATPILRLELVASVFNKPTSEQLDQLSATVRNLSDAGRHLLIQWDGIDVWWPTDAELEELAFRRSTRSAELIAEFFQFERSTYRLIDITSGDGPPAAPSPAEALEDALSDMVRGPRFDDVPGACEERRRAAEKEYRQLISHHFVRSLISQAMNSADSIEGPLKFQLAHSFQFAQLCVPAIQEQLEQLINNGIGEGEMNSELWKVFTKFTNDQFRLSKELRKKD